MKKIILSLIVALSAVAANAQGFGPMNPEDMAKFQAERVKETCATTDDQYKALYTLYLEQSKKMMEEMEANRSQGGQPFNMEAIRKRMEETDKKIKAILNEEQYAKYEEMQKQMRSRFGGGGPGGPRQ